jgi:hypothetical protein
MDGVPSWGDLRDTQLSIAVSILQYCCVRRPAATTVKRDLLLPSLSFCAAPCLAIGTNADGHVKACFRKGNIAPYNIANCENGRPLLLSRSGSPSGVSKQQRTNRGLARDVHVTIRAAMMILFEKDPTAMYNNASRSETCLPGHKNTTYPKLWLGCIFSLSLFFATPPHLLPRRYVHTPMARPRPPSPNLQ